MKLDQPMDDTFILPVFFEGKELELPARLLRFGYTVKIEVEIEGTTVVFEPDEERRWRALIGLDDVVAGKKVKHELLEAVAQVIEDVTR
jgi:hypothetical protein